MKMVYFLIGTVLIFSNCKSQEDITSKVEYLRHVGDIKSEDWDDDFQLCNDESKVIQYFNNSKGLEYEGERSTIIKAFQDKFKPSIRENQNGKIRIRFVVNCKGEAGRFRILQGNESYEAFEFDPLITEQLLAITKSLKGWKEKKLGDIKIDYYQYLLFVIKEGEIIEILP